MELAAVLKDIAKSYSLSEDELVAKYITQQQDVDNLAVPRLKEIIQRLGGDIKGKKKKQEWVDIARKLLDGNSKTEITKQQMLCEVRQFGDRRCAFHPESGRIYSIENNSEIGMWSEEKGPIFFETTGIEQ
tara:strand:- start:2539 stop:2931 length:393 start_codon:yes stop_codon:yes gene_type:complete